MCVCILDQAGTILVHKNVPAPPQDFLRVSAPYRDDQVVAVECIFTCSQYNLHTIGKKLAYKANREGVEEHFPDPSVRKGIEVDLALIDHYDTLLTELELYLARTAKEHDVNTFSRLRSVPGVGKILALVILSEVQAITRFPRVQDFSPTAAWSKALRSPPGSALAPRARKSAMRL